MGRKARLKREQEEIEEFEAEQEEELNKAIAFSEQCSQLSQFEELRKKVGEEVAAVPEAALIRFQLPSQGKGNVKILRRFLKTDTVQVCLTVYVCGTVSCNFGVYVEYTRLPCTSLL